MYLPSVDQPNRLQATDGRMRQSHANNIAWGQRLTRIDDLRMREFSLSNAQTFQKLSQ
jgi:hypothetical protein